jgi:hypothetical protein
MNDGTYPPPTVEQLLAAESCREAARRYSYGIDRLDVDTCKSAFWPDATDVHGANDGNAWEFFDKVVPSHARWTFTMHSIYNHQVDVDAGGDTARGEMYCITNLFRAEEREMSTWYGRYQDAYERRGDEWRIIRRICVHHGTTVEPDVDPMAIDAAPYRQAAFDRPAAGRPIGP